MCQLISDSNVNLKSCKDLSRTVHVKGSKWKYQSWRKKQEEQEGQSRQWEPTTFLVVWLSLGKHKAVLIKSLPCNLCPWNRHFSGSQGAKECKPVGRPTPKSWQVRSRNTRLFQLNKDLLSCCYVRQSTILGPGRDTKMHKVQMTLAENSAPLPLYRSPPPKEGVL